RLQSCVLVLSDRTAVEQLLAFPDLLARVVLRSDGPDVVVRLRLRLLRLLDVPLRHRAPLTDQVDERTEERQKDQKDRPERLGPAPDVVAAEDVREDRDQEPDPDHPREED